MDGAIFPLRASAETRQVRFMTAGSVDDGKSTLIGRLLLDSGVLMRDQAASIGDDEEDLAALRTGLRPSARRASPSTLHIAISRRRAPASSSPMRRGTNNTHAIW